MATGMMLLFTVVSHAAPEAMIGVFSKDSAVIGTGAEYLRVISWNYVASGLIFVCSSMFQAMGNTVPSLVASATRIALVAAPALVLARRPGFQLHWVWYLSVAAVFVQLGLCLWLLRREFSRRLSFGASAPPGAVQSAAGVTVHAD